MAGEVVLSIDVRKFEQVYLNLDFIKRCVLLIFHSFVSQALSRLGMDLSCNHTRIHLALYTGSTK